MKDYFKKNILQIRYITGVVSVLLMVVSILMFAVKGLNMGLDFTGGMVSEVEISNSITNEQLLSTLEPVLGEATTVTRSGEEGRWIIRYPIPPVGHSAPDMTKILSAISPDVTIVSSSMVGAQVGQDLYDQGGLALLVCIICILGYLSFRFEWRLASGSILALVHDVVLVLGFFAYTQMEFNLTVFAAVLAILGYSLNDSIIISDRIRELLLSKQDESIKEINNEAVIATFSRTMVTSGTTLMTIVALWVMGGGPLEGFSIAMFIGIISGTWSSISIGTILPEWLKLEPKHYLPPEISDEP